MLFDEYPSEQVLKKYTTVDYVDLPSSFLPNFGFRNNQNIYSNFTNTEMSTTSLLTGVNQTNYTINQTINALQNNVFTNHKDYQFNYVSIFDENNRKNSLVSVQFFEGNNSLLIRYIIPYILHYFSTSGFGLFTDYESYHNRVIQRLNQITKSHTKTVTYVHFYTPHNYPLVERISFENRIRNANNWMKKSIHIIEENDPTSGIIIFSDHGLRLNKIPKKVWIKNILYYKNVTIDTSVLNNNGLTSLFSTIIF